MVNAWTTTDSSVDAVLLACASSLEDKKELLLEWFPDYTARAEALLLQNSEDIISLLPHCDELTQRRVLSRLTVDSHRLDTLRTVLKGLDVAIIRPVLLQLESTALIKILQSCNAANLIGAENKEHCRVWFRSLRNSDAPLMVQLIQVMKNLPEDKDLQNKLSTTTTVKTEESLSPAFASSNANSQAPPLDPMEEGTPVEDEARTPQLSINRLSPLAGHDELQDAHPPPTSLQPRMSISSTTTSEGEDDDEYLSFFGSRSRATDDRRGCTVAASLPPTMLVAQPPGHRRSLSLESSESSHSTQHDYDYAPEPTPAPVREEFERSPSTTRSGVHVDGSCCSNWDPAKSAIRAKQFENLVDSNQAATFPFATQWMLRTREEAAGGAERLEALRNAEQLAFEATPSDVQNIAGRPLFLRSRLDWEVRRYMAKDLAVYPVNAGCTAVTQWVSARVSEVLVRFPDLSMEHPRRSSWIRSSYREKTPSNVSSLYRVDASLSTHGLLQVIRDWLTSTARALRTKRAQSQLKEVSGDAGIKRAAEDKESRDRFSNEKRRRLA